MSTNPDHLTDALAQASTAPLPCPFCGGTPEFENTDERARLRCTGCGTEGGLFFYSQEECASGIGDETEARAIEAWNRRSAAGDQKPNEHESAAARLPKLPEPQLRGQCIRGYTPEQVELIRREAVQACIAIAEANGEDEPYGHAKFRCANIAAALRALLDS